MSPKVVTIEAPPETQVVSPQPEPERGSPHQSKISEDGRRLLREGMTAIGLPSGKGNQLADWFDKHPSASFSIEGKTPLDPLNVFSSPDVVPMPPRRPQPEPDE